MKSWLHVLYAIILAALSFFTGEIVTFIMLGFILISLQNIYAVLKDLLRVNRKRLDSNGM